ncbi:hypothetical protein QVA66_03025 [Staphylococcus chromogenes]|nr:hypothetical protein [Staphylococcus chromogenes]
MLKNAVIFFLLCLVFWGVGALFTLIFESYDIIWSAPLWVPLLAAVATAAWHYLR